MSDRWCRPGSRLLLLAAAWVAPACAGTEPAPGPEPGGQRPDAAADGSVRRAEGGGVEAAVPVQDEAAVGRALLELDRRVDEYVFLGTQTGEDVAQRRDLLESALEASVAQYLPTLLDAAGRTDDPVRRRIAAKSLGFSRDPRAVPALSGALQVRGDAHVLAGATFSLSRIADPQTPLAPLVETARDPDVDVRNNSLLALWHVLDARSENGLPPADGPTRVAILGAAEPALFDLGDPMVRGHAAATLGALGDARAVDSLTNLLRDQHPFVRTQTALALGKLGDRRALPALLDAIDTSPSGTPKSAVILGISVLLEKEGVAIPPGLPAEGRAWKQFAERALGASEGVRVRTR